MKLTKDQALGLRSILEKQSRNEKHIGYHILPECFDTVLKGTEYENNYVFWEKERFSYFVNKVEFYNKKVVDVGCNVGYFLFGVLECGAREVIGYEGKDTCGEFINKAVNFIDSPERFNFINEYFQFEGEAGSYDVGLLLNVLHHLGDDYGESSLSMTAAKKKMLDQLNGLSKNVETLIFQMGFNWKGDRHSCLFPNGTKAEMIEFIREGTYEFWEVQDIGIAERKKEGGVVYQPLSEKNILRDDSMGEFLNRPIFVLRTKMRG